MTRDEQKIRATLKLDIYIRSYKIQCQCIFSLCIYYLLQCYCKTLKSIVTLFLSLTNIVDTAGGFVFFVFWLLLGFFLFSTKDTRHYCHFRGILHLSAGLYKRTVESILFHNNLMIPKNLVSMYNIIDVQFQSENEKIRHFMFMYSTCRGHWKSQVV